LGGTGIYVGNLQGTLTGKRYLIITNEEGNWRLRREILPPYDQNTFKVGKF
jgi:hypothetical protein